MFESLQIPGAETITSNLKTENYRLIEYLQTYKTWLFSGAKILHERVRFFVDALVQHTFKHTNCLYTKFVTFNPIQGRLRYDIYDAAAP